MVRAGDHAFHVVERGAGRPVLLVHGLSGQTRHFSALMPELARDHPVVAVDRPGSGYSPRASGAGGGPVEQAAAIAALIDALGLDRPLVVGHSLGGAVALALGLNHGARVGGLALVCPATQPITEPPAMFRRLVIHSDAVRRLVGWTLMVPVSVRSGPELLAAVFSPEPVPDDFGMTGGALLSLRPEAFRNASLDAVSLADDLAGMATRYRDLAVPAAVLYGRDDAVLNPALHGESMAEAGVRLTMWEGGHMLPVTRAPAVADWIRGLEREWRLAPSPNEL